MMSWMSLLFDAVMAGLLIAMMVFAIKLNRRLLSLRERDAEIRVMIDQFRAAADQADASATKLKSTGIEAERTLRAALQEAASMRDDLARLTAPRAAAPLASVENTARDTGGDKGSFADILRTPVAGGTVPAAAPERARSEVERELIEAIRAARVES